MKKAASTPDCSPSSMANCASLPELKRARGSSSSIRMLLPAMCDTGYKSITLRVHGPKSQKLATTLMRLATVELLRANIGESINVINVEHFARSRGIELAQITETNPPAGLAGEVVELEVNLPGGESHRVLGTVYADGLPRVVRVDRFAMDMVPEGNMVLLLNADLPGVIGMVGNAFGAAGVNIANMTISRGTQGANEVQLMLIKTDTAATDGLLTGLRSRPQIMRAKTLVLPPR